MIVVAGTGTGIGKTHVACALLRASQTGAVGLKPVETGLAGGAAGSDQERLTRASFHVKQSAPLHLEPAPFQFAPPLSPHLASRKAGVRIDLGQIRAWITRSRADRPAVIETAGGLFSPLAPGITNLDLILALSPTRTLLVAPDRLGTLHDVSATLGLARCLKLHVAAVVLSEPEVPDPSTGTNAAELEALGIAQVTAVFPRASETDPRTLEAARNTLRALL
jgi:dethiobiotin synthetase